MKNAGRGNTVRRWLTVAGIAAAAGGCVLGQATIAAAATAGPGITAQAASPAAYHPSGHVIVYGSRGPAVRALQRRLDTLHYWVGKPDGVFGDNTLEGVWAFKEVQGLPTRKQPDNVGLAMQRKLVHPRAPKILVRKGGKNRIEVNQNDEVLVLYHRGKIELISHVSSGGGYYYPCPGDSGATCGPAITPDGNYTANWFAKGWVKVPLGTMYNPVFFIGGAYAIHGDIPVPLYAASHGCVRIPMGIAQWFHKKLHIAQGKGTPIYIRGHV